MWMIEIDKDFLKKYREEVGKAIENAIDFFLEGNTYNDYYLDENERAILRLLKNKYLHDDSDNNILTAKPRKLHTIIIEIDKLYCRKSFNERILSKLFDYEYFKENKVCAFPVKQKKNVKRRSPKRTIGRIEFFKALNVNTCPYCNRQYINKTEITTGHKRDKIIYPALDHYWSKSNYPYLAISIYNLIPCCTFCNSNIKGNIDLDLDRHGHPYENSLHDKIKFIPRFLGVGGFYGNPNELKIIVQPKNKQGEMTAEFFGLEDQYQSHKDYIAEILIKKQAYNEDWAAGLSAALGKTFTVEEAIRIYYGNYLNEKDINKRPLSKLTMDLLED